MADRLRRPTMNDVARVAGVSLKSVSRVINDEVGASPDTRERVLAAAAKLGYRRNDAAHALRRSDGRSASVGLVLEDVSNPFAAVLNRSVERVASQEGSLVLAVSTNADPDREEQLIHRLLARAVDSLVVMSCRRDHAFLEPEVHRGLAGGVRGPAAPPAACPTVRVANGKGGHDATSHLIRRGHRRIGFLGDRPGLYTAEERQRGWSRAMREAGLTADPALVWRGHADPAQAELAMDAMLDLPDPPTAVFAAQNLIAVGVLAALRHRGAAHRVAVVGFDDLDLAPLVDPPLTVIAQDPEAIGRVGTEAVFAALAGSPMTKDVVLPVRLVTRGSGELPGPFA